LAAAAATLWGQEAGGCRPILREIPEGHGLVRWENHRSTKKRLGYSLVNKQFALENGDL
jgi:hypothetical protein